MSETNPVVARYIGTDYFHANPSWDSEDSPWKASKVCELIAAHNLHPGSIVDVGCGAGLVLAELRRAFPAALLTGYDVAPDAARFWAPHREQDIELFVGDFTASPLTSFDVLLALDVVEHLQDPYTFLELIRQRARHFIFHFPLDLSAASVLRETPLLHVRRKVGHLHFYTRRLALALLEECGYYVIDARYTGAAFSGPQHGWKTRLARLPRRLLYALNHDWGARLLGGETLIVLADAGSQR